MVELPVPVVYSLFHVFLVFLCLSHNLLMPLLQVVIDVKVMWR